MEKELNTYLKKLKEMNCDRTGFTTPPAYFENIDDSIMNAIHEDSLPDKTGFDIPENYFDNLEDSIFNKINEEAIPAVSGFEVPEDYFNNLENSILSKIKPKKNNKIRNLLVAFTSSAAALVLFYFGFSQYEQPEVVTFESLTITEINDWIQEDNIILDSYAIADISYENDGDDMDIKFISESITDQELNDYLETTTEFDFLYIED